MARIRSIKPEFWDDELMGKLSRDARLLYIGTWNLADDEGRLRWSAAYLKAHLFMYDTDLDLKGVTALMKELANAKRIEPYKSNDQWYGVVIHFGEHQKPNRPLPSKLPAPDMSAHGGLTEESVSSHGGLTPVVEVEVEVGGEVEVQSRGASVRSLRTSNSTTDKRVAGALALADHFRVLDGE